MTSPAEVAQAMWREDHASRSLGMELEEVGAGSARLSMTMQQHMANAEKLFAYACNAS